MTGTVCAQPIAANANHRTNIREFFIEEFFTACLASASNEGNDAIELPYANRLCALRVLNRLAPLLHRAETVVIEGKSYRMTERRNEEPAA
jgi:hypothetical protein